MSLVLEAQGLTKSFGAVRALTDGRLKVARGEIHALLGANGCGKSTLCKIAAGTLAPDGGKLLLEGAAAAFASPREAEKAGIALFYQELSLIPHLSVAENLHLGREPRRLGLVDRREMRRRSAELIALFDGVAGSGLAPEAVVGDLPPDQRQILEILKVFAKSPRLMILDEATAALDARQTRRFFEILRARKAEGISAIMISHRLDEVFEICDRITVMRNGATIAELETASATREEVVRHMIGEVPHPAPRLGAKAEAPEVLKIEGAANARLRGVSLTARRGEILGLAGLQGQGQSALLQGLFGALPFASGRVEFEGREIRPRRPAEAARAGFAYVSGDRGRDAALTGRPIFENLAAALIARGRGISANPARLRPQVEAAARGLRTKYAGLEAPIGSLSGGNQQKIFIARWLATRPKLLLLDDPTKGIDLGAKADLFALMRAQAEAGATVLFASSEDAEILDHADRVLVFNGGRISAELEGDALTAAALACAAFGEAA